MPETETEVVVQISGEDVIAGRLWSHRRRGTESATFAYDAAYLARADGYALDPTLDLHLGQQQTPAGRPLFGAFGDAAPDRWGRRLIARTERRRARREGDAERSFGEVDYLLGVRDDLRQGALRFRPPGQRSYLADDDSGVPALIDLPVLLSASERLERDEATEADLATLFRGGSSLGGARPKAHVLDGHGRLAIAKLPSPANDDWDVIRWESVALRLATDAGITTPSFQLHTVDGKAVLIVDRFDRHGRQRIGYVSAMTMLEATDGDRGTYTEIATVIEDESPSATSDLRELWRRIAFTLLITNTDDHLRNHGFLHDSSAGWSLSPVFDVNPDPRAGAAFFSTTLDLDRPEATVEHLLHLAGLFRLDPTQARAVLAEVVAATRRWREVAAAQGLGGAAIEDMTRAFEHDRARAAERALEHGT